MDLLLLLSWAGWRLDFCFTLRSQIRLSMKTFGILPLGIFFSFLKSSSNVKFTSSASYVWNVFVVSFQQTKKLIVFAGYSFVSNRNWFMNFSQVTYAKKVLKIRNCSRWWPRGLVRESQLRDVLFKMICFWYCKINEENLLDDPNEDQSFGWFTAFQIKSSTLNCEQHLVGVLRGPLVNPQRLWSGFLLEDQTRM